MEYRRCYCKVIDSIYQTGLKSFEKSLIKEAENFNVHVGAETRCIKKRKNG